jgi:hypothetical protein
MFEYPRLKLTRPSDRFPALAGLARRFYEMTGPKPGLSYLAGFFAIKESDLLKELLWMVTRPGPRSPSTYTRKIRESGAPSWSWASMFVNGSDYVGSLTFGVPTGIRKNYALKIIEVSFDPDSEDNPFSCKYLAAYCPRALQFKQVYVCPADAVGSQSKGKDEVQSKFRFMPDCDLWNAGTDEPRSIVFLVWLGSLGEDALAEDVGFVLKHSPHRKGLWKELVSGIVH